MPRKRQGPKIETRLAESDHRRFQRLVAERETTMAQVCRDAILFYLDHADAKQLTERQSDLESRIRALDDRLSRLIAQAGVDLGTLLHLLYARLDPETRDEELTTADQQSKVSMRRNFTKTFAEIIDDPNAR